MEDEYFNGMYDVIFKNALCIEENKDILKMILETCMEQRIDDILFGDKELKKNRIKSKGMIVDVIARCGKKVINIEINNSQSTLYRKRNMLYLCNIYGEIFNKGDNYDDEAECAQINFSLLALDKQKVIAKYIVREVDDGLVWDKDYRIIEVNMDLLEKMYYNNDVESISKYRELVMLILNKKELEKLSEGDEIVERYKNRVDELNSSREKRLELLAERRQILEENTLIYTKNKMKLEKTLIKSEKKDLKTERENLKVEKNNLKTEKNNLKVEKNNLKAEKNDLKTEKESFETEKESFETEKESFETEKSKINFRLLETAKKLKSLGISLEEIHSVTGITIEKIETL